MSVIEYVTFGVVVVTLLAGVVAVGSLAIEHVRQFLQLRRGVVTEVRCPRYDQLTRVRIGVPEGDARLHVLWCERHPDGAPRCERACFPLLSSLRPERPVAIGS